MGYLRLNPECHLVAGVTRGCIYNLVTGDMISIGGLETGFLLKTRGNLTVEESLSGYPEGDRNTLHEFVRQLIQRDLAREYSKPYSVRPLQRGLPGDLSTLFQPDRLVLLQLEVVQECGLDCSFCRKPALFGRGTGCGRYRDRIEAPLTLEQQLDVLAQAAALGAREIMLTGGDPLCSEKCTQLARAAIDLGYEIVTIWTCGVSPLPNELYALGDKVRLIFQVFSDREDVHDQLAGVPGAFKALIANLTKLRTRNRLDTRLVLVVSPENADHYPESVAFYQQFSCIPVEIRPLYSVGCQSSGLDSLRQLTRVNRWFTKVSPQIFGAIHRCHPCFMGKLAVTDDGRVLPCLLGRNWVLGDLRRDTLAKIIKQGQHKTYWYLTKDRLDKCAQCEFRYGCFDCRVIQGDGESLCAVLHCDYDCETGEWRETDSRSVPAASGGK